MALYQAGGLPSIASERRLLASQLPFSYSIRSQRQLDASKTGAFRTES
jgi:hypothetical protein